MRRPETGFATARVFTGHWLPSQVRALLVKVRDKPDRVIVSLHGVSALLELLTGVVGQPLAALPHCITRVSANRIGRISGRCRRVLGVSDPRV